LLSSNYFTELLPQFTSEVNQADCGRNDKSVRATELREWMRKLANPT